MKKKPKKTLAKTLEGATVKGKATEPVWKGPEVDGITQSLLSLFLVCRERFRLRVVEGLRVKEGFNHRLEYGNMHHLCEETHLQNGNWKEDLSKHASCLCHQYKFQQEEVLKWYNVCLVQFPLYLAYWKRNKSKIIYKPLLQEETFRVPYKLPDGRVVQLRGKWDSVDLVERGKDKGIWLKENKTKGEVKEEQIKRQLTFDLQTMLYLVVLKKATGLEEYGQLAYGDKVRGVRYCVVRRPLSGGKGSIRPHKATKNKAAETGAEYYARLGGIIEENADDYFMRWTVEITAADIEKFEKEFLRPALMELCEWWDVIMARSDNPFAYSERSRHYRLPYGIWNPIAEGRVTEVDEYLATGSTLGLDRVDNLFPELI